jgi:hypothetical protein
MAYSCHCNESWGQEDARGWWRAHLPHLTGSLAVSTRRDSPEHVVSM